MKYLVTGKEMREYDNNTILYGGIDGLTLMERAAEALKKEILALKCYKKILIICGIGNNGGDGLALARLLSDADCEVSICIKGDLQKATESFCEQISRLKMYPVIRVDEAELKSKSKTAYDVVVDALFGVGLSRIITDTYSEVVKAMNRFNAFKIAVDIPSGISADTGKVLGCAFEADMTVTFAYGKIGLYQFPGASYAGKVKVYDIGIHDESFRGNIPDIFTYDVNPLDVMPVRKPDGNKGSFGKVLIIAGFETMTGAAILCARAAMETGAGMVKVLSPIENRSILQVAVPEVLYAAANEWELEKALKWADVVIAGPGMGRSDLARELLAQLFDTADQPLIIDADALNLLSEDMVLTQKICAYQSPKIMTPHMMEFARLTKKTILEVKDDCLSIAKILAKEYHSIVVCKDARTLVVREEGTCYMNLTGNNGMATAGSGDVLAGMIGSLLAQGLLSFEGACTAVYLHGLAGDISRNIYTEYGVTASRLVENIRNIGRSD